MKKSLPITAQIFLAVLIGTLITKWAISSGFAGSIVGDGLANKFFRWTLNLLGIIGWEDAEMFMIVSIWCPTTLLIFIATRLLSRKLRGS